MTIRGNKQLARARVGCVELAVGDVPDAFNATAGTKEEGGRSQCHKRHQQSVLDEILSLIVFPEVAKCVHVQSPILFITLQVLGHCMTPVPELSRWRKQKDRA